MMLAPADHRCTRCGGCCGGSCRRSFPPVNDDDIDWRMHSCIACGEPLVVLSEDACSTECAADLERSLATTGQCQWCHRFGPLGKPCIRKVPGTGEVDECGSFQ